MENSTSIRIRIRPIWAELSPGYEGILACADSITAGQLVPTRQNLVIPHRGAQPQRWPPGDNRSAPRMTGQNVANALAWRLYLNHHHMCAVFLCLISTIR